MNAVSLHLLLPRVKGQGTNAAVAAAGVPSAGRRKGRAGGMSQGREHFPKDTAASPKSNPGRGGRGHFSATFIHPDLSLSVDSLHGVFGKVTPCVTEDTVSAAGRGSLSSCT